MITFLFSVHTITEAKLYAGRSQGGGSSSHVIWPDAPWCSAATEYKSVPSWFRPRICVSVWCKHWHIIFCRCIVGGICRMWITAELNTASSENVVTLEAESTSVTMAANDAVTLSSVYDGMSIEGSSHQLTQETSSSLPQIAEQSNNASSTQHTRHGTTTNLITTQPTTSEADTTAKEQTQSTANLMNSQQTTTFEQTSSQVTTTVFQSTVTSPSPPDVHCCCRCCFPSTSTCTFCDGDSLTDASECANHPHTVPG